MHVSHILPHFQSLLEALFTAFLTSNFDHLLFHHFAQPSSRLCSALLCIPPPVFDILYYALRTENLLLGLFECVFVQPELLCQAYDLALRDYARIIGFFKP